MNRHRLTVEIQINNAQPHEVPALAVTALGQLQVALDQRGITGLENGKVMTFNSAGVITRASLR